MLTTEIHMQSLVFTIGTGPILEGREALLYMVDQQI